ncbi:hypothetical protein G5I_03278 [Acromyrmex echinatior]|uniref:Uncharacterized protein n=1 Tax=Acromyrmex echinatior TaxID=103372 RepID=F4WCK2_ACREC|nr:hypothetical protein G5I_03278 [Acromyrmex echinatior]
MIHPSFSDALPAPRLTKFTKRWASSGDGGAGGSKFDNHSNDSCCVDSAHSDQLLRRARARTCNVGIFLETRPRMRAPTCGAFPSSGRCPELEAKLDGNASAERREEREREDGE